MGKYMLYEQVVLIYELGIIWEIVLYVWDQCFLIYRHEI